MKINSYGLSSKDYASLYNVWHGMRLRCYDSKNKEFSNYGGRGITISPKWSDFHSFVKWALSNGWAVGLTIERINVNEGYSPENCTFIPKKKQAYNRTDTVWITYQGKTQSLAEWAYELGINRNSLQTRYSRGDRDPERLFRPLDKVPTRLSVGQYQDGILINIFPSPLEASKATGIYYTSICRSCKSETLRAGGYKWEYVKEN